MKLEKKLEKRRCICWYVDDFAKQANDIYENTKNEFINAKKWQDVYDETKFPEALNAMINEHDSDVGISWNTLTIYLNEYCKRKERKLNKREAENLVVKFYENCFEYGQNLYYAYYKYNKYLKEFDYYLHLNIKGQKIIFTEEELDDIMYVMNANIDNQSFIKNYPKGYLEGIITIHAVSGFLLFIVRCKYNDENKDLFFMAYPSELSNKNAKRLDIDKAKNWNEAIKDYLYDPS